MCYMDCAFLKDFCPTLKVPQLHKKRLVHICFYPYILIEIGAKQFTVLKFGVIYLPEHRPFDRFVYFIFFPTNFI